MQTNFSSIRLQWKKKGRLDSPQTTRTVTQLWLLCLDKDRFTYNLITKYILDWTPSSNAISYSVWMGAILRDKQKDVLHLLYIRYLKSSQATKSYASIHTQATRCEREPTGPGSLQKRCILQLIFKYQGFYVGMHVSVSYPYTGLVCVLLNPAIPIYFYNFFCCFIYLFQAWFIQSRRILDAKQFASCTNVKAYILVKSGRGNGHQ